MKNPKQSIGRTSSHKTSSSSSSAIPLNPNIPKSFYESSKNPPKPPSQHNLPPQIPPSSNPDIPGPSSIPPPPPYSFHNLDRRTIFLADGTVRSYFALPPDYQADHNFFLSSLQQPFDPYEGGGGSSSLKRKYGEEEFVRHQHRQEQQQQQQQQRLSVGDEMRMNKQVKLGGDVDEKGLKDAFLRLSKSVNESLMLKKGGFEDGKNGPLHCIVCGRFGVTVWIRFFFFCILGL